MHKIAVLIPTYKPGSYLKKCLECLEHQTLSKEAFKVYIALNGSESRYKNYVLNILKNFNFNYCFIYLTEPGVSNARNFLIEHSTEEFITFIDDDDQISDNYLESFLSIASPDYMPISNSLNFSNSDTIKYSNYIGEAFLRIKNKETSKFRTRKYYSSPWAKLLHREMIGNIRFNTKLSVGEDSLFMAEISSNIKGVVKTGEATYYYVNQREGSATRSNVNRWMEIKRILYLLTIYNKMLISSDKNRIFILTRIIATLKHFKRII